VIFFTRNDQEEVKGLIRSSGIVNRDQQINIKLTNRSVTSNMIAGRQ